MYCAWLRLLKSLSFLFYKIVDFLIIYFRDSSWWAIHAHPIWEYRCIAHFLCLVSDCNSCSCYEVQTPKGLIYKKWDSFQGSLVFKFLVHISLLFIENHMQLYWVLFLLTYFISLVLRHRLGLLIIYWMNAVNVDILFLFLILGVKHLGCQHSV